MNIVIIDCGAGNLHSVRKAFASQLPDGAALNVVTDAAALNDATHIVLPGVGAFADCMNGLNALPGMRTALEQNVLQQKKPFLGICVGMQMLFERGHEHGTHAGLGWLQGEVQQITPNDPSLKIPHMGWNQLHFPLPHRGRAGEGPLGNVERNNGPLPTSPLRVEGSPPHPVLQDISEGDFAYFVHSYAAVHVQSDEILATTSYGGDIVAMVGRDNIVATQFHPEKSQAVGLRMIKNFLIEMR